MKNSGTSTACDFRDITACAIATSCCISDVPSQWESQISHLVSGCLQTTVFYTDKLVQMVIVRLYLMICVGLQKSWEQKWQMSFNTKKCYCMHIGRMITRTTNFTYQMNGQTLYHSILTSVSLSRMIYAQYAGICTLTVCRRRQRECWVSFVGMSFTVHRMPKLLLTRHWYDQN